MNLKLMILFIQATVLSLIQYFPGFTCQNNREYDICRQPFECGGLRNLSYPFWGGSRPQSCGYPGFGLDCRANDSPILNISSLSYKILEVDFSSYTLRIARHDLWNTTCPTILHNTTLNLETFEFPPDSNDQNVTIYYGCVQNRTDLNQFTCDVNGVNTVNLFGPGPRPGITCNDNISIPVNQTAARALNTRTNMSVNALRDALAGGFYVRWSANNDYCQGCVQSGGKCGYQENSTSVVCYDQNQTTGQGAPAPLPFPQVPRGRSASARKRTRIGLIVGQVLGMAVAILITAFTICYIRRRCSSQGLEQVSNQDIEKFLCQHGSLALKRYKFPTIKKMTKSFSVKLGQGGYGSVYKGDLPDGSLVAVKVLMESDDSNGEEFINEVASISKTSHVNIVNLLGFCFDRNKRALVYEFMPNKSLDKFIGNHVAADTQCPLDLDKLYKIAFGVAKGLEYLHTGCNTKIVHFDIKPQNILLDEDFCPKISDFGLAKLCKKKQSILSVLGTRGTIGYIAPEVFSRNYGGVSHKSDVYSYGMMVLEMFGARKLDENTDTIQSNENYFPDKIYKQVTNFSMKLEDLMIEEEEETARKMVLVGFWCIQTIPSDRPSMSKVVEMLEGSLQTVQIPPKPILFTSTTTTTTDLSTLDVSSSFSTHLETEMSDEV